MIAKHQQKVDLETLSTINVVLSAYESVLAQEIYYVSTPITSGKRLYDVLSRTGLTLDELRSEKDLFFSDVIKPNIDESVNISNRIVSDRNVAVVSPGIFEAKSLGWTQSEYMFMWLQFLERKATALIPVDGWEYSNGGVEEVTYSTISPKIRVETGDYQPLSLTEVVERITEALFQVWKTGVEPRVHAECLWKLNSETTAKMPSEVDYLFQEAPELLTEIDPRFLSERPTAKLLSERMKKAEDIHLLRTREGFPDGINLKISR